MDTINLIIQVLFVLVCVKLTIDAIFKCDDNLRKEESEDGVKENCSNKD